IRRNLKVESLDAAGRGAVASIWKPSPQVICGQEQIDEQVPVGFGTERQPPFAKQGSASPHTAHAAPPGRIWLSTPIAVGTSVKGADSSQLAKPCAWASVTGST